MCIIGLPSVLLAFQPNKDLVEGHFMSNVFKKCIPGGVALVIAVLSVYLYDLLGAGAGLSPLQLSGSFAGQYKTMLIVAVVYTGFMALLVVCSPFDKYRGVVCLITFFIATLCLTGVVALINLIGIEQFQFFGKGVVVFFELDFQYLTFLLSIICINYFVISGMTKLVNSIKTKNKGDKSNGNQPT
jgi:cation-transporting ATPase E